MSWVEAIILLSAGVFAGAINTLAGGGSLITVPILISMGLPGSEANASNRVAIFIQNIFAVSGFKSKGVSVFPYAFWAAIVAMFGAVIGAYVAVDISNELFNKVLAIVMVMVLILTVFKPYFSVTQVNEIFNPKRKFWSLFTFFFLGIYGGFIQAGIGFLIIATLTGIHGFNMAKTNSIKVFVALCYTGVALTIFILEDKVRWEYGLVLAAGNATGAWLSSRWSVDKDDKWIRLILIVSVSALAIKLWFFS